MLRDGLERRSGPLISLDCDNATSPFGKQGAGEPARPRTDFNNGAPRKRTGAAGDTAVQVLIKYEMLTEALAGRQLQTTDDVAERRKIWRAELVVWHSDNCGLR
jgi:hypothetical protein